MTHGEISEVHKFFASYHLGPNYVDPRTGELKFSYPCFQQAPAFFTTDLPMRGFPAASVPASQIYEANGLKGPQVAAKGGAGAGDGEGGEEVEEPRRGAGRVGGNSQLPADHMKYVRVRARVRVRNRETDRVEFKVKGVICAQYVGTPLSTPTRPEPRPCPAPALTMTLNHARSLILLIGIGFHLSRACCAVSRGGESR